MKTAIISDIHSNPSDLDSISFVELELGNKEHLEKFADFYENVFAKNFAYDEIGSMQAYIDLKEADEKDSHTYHLTFCEKDGRFIGCFIFMCFPQINSMVGEFACVDSPFRGQGIASTLIHNSLAAHPCDWLFGEVEKANLPNLAGWQRFGFRKIPVDYTQLSLGEGRKAVDNMFLCVNPVIPSNWISSQLVRDFVYHYYKFSQSCPSPETNDEFVRLKDRCRRVPSFELENLV